MPLILRVSEESETALKKWKNYINILCYEIQILYGNKTWNIYHVLWEHQRKMNFFFFFSYNFLFHLFIKKKETRECNRRTDFLYLLTSLKVFALLWLVWTWIEAFGIKKIREIFVTSSILIAFNLSGIISFPCIILLTTRVIWKSCILYYRKTLNDKNIHFVIKG